MNLIFKLLIAAVVAIVLIYLFLTYFGPYYLWPPDPINAISLQLGKAELDLGKSQSAVSLFLSDFSTKVAIFESSSRSVAFNCNDILHCCDKGLSGKGCANKIVWDERKIYFSSTLNTTITARCFEDDLYICKVFIGKKPAQLDANVNYEKILDMAKNPKFSAILSINNIGDLGTQDIIIQGSLYLKNDDGSKKLVDEYEGQMMPLLAKDKNYAQINFSPKSSGKYLVELHIYDGTDLTDFANLNIEFEAINAPKVSLCKATQATFDFDIVSEKCKARYLCENCDFAFECKEAWEKQGEINLLAADHTKAENYVEDDFCALESADDLPEAEDPAVIQQTNNSVALPQPNLPNAGWVFPVLPEEMQIRKSGKLRVDSFNHPNDAARYNPAAYLSNRRCKSIHRGQDIYGDYKKQSKVQVRAIGEGTVLRVSSAWVYILHDLPNNLQITSAYGHVIGDKSLVGQKVKAGQVIAIMQKTIKGKDDSSHLHLELYSKKITSVPAKTPRFKDNESECDAWQVIKPDDPYLINPIDVIGKYS